MLNFCTRAEKCICHNQIYPVFCLLNNDNVTHSHPINYKGALIEKNGKPEKAVAGLLGDHNNNDTQGIP